MSDWNITEEVARKVLTTVDAGLVKGVGKPEPGKMTAPKGFFCVGTTDCPTCDGSGDCP